MCSHYEQEQPYPLPFLVQACQHLWLVACHDVYRQFTMLTIPLSLALSPRDACSDQILSRFTDAVIAELHCSKGFRQSRHPLCLPQ